MSLQDVAIDPAHGSLPDEVTTLLQAANSRIRRFVPDKGRHITGFVPSDSEIVFRALSTLVQSDLLTGRSFCEWGSGFGTATCLAAMLGLDAYGFEIETQLVTAARSLANDFQLPATFVQGSFVPCNRRWFSEETYEDNNGRYPWLRNNADNGYQLLGRELGTFDVVFAYPWPGEEYYIDQLFNEGAAHGAILLTYGDHLPKYQSLCQCWMELDSGTEAQRPLHNHLLSETMRTENLQTLFARFVSSICRWEYHTVRNHSHQMPLEYSQH